MPSSSLVYEMEQGNNDKKVKVTDGTIICVWS